MAPTHADIDARLRELRASYTERLPTRGRDLAEQWERLCAAWSAEALQTYHRSVHTLVGSAATYGLHAVSAAAWRLEQALQMWLEREPPGPIERAAITERVSEVGRVIELALMAERAQPPAPAPAPDSERAAYTVIILDTDQVRADDLARQVLSFGYSALAVARLEDLPAALPAPAVLVANLALAAAQPDLLAQARARAGGSLPSLFISEQHTVASRLQAVRLGGEAFFTLPVEASALVDKIDRITGAYTGRPLRILVLDDSRSAALYVAAILERAGMFVRVLHDPLRLLDQLDEFQPDLVLMDIYMPGCTGLELAAVIRQQEQHIGLPIVFLSGGKDQPLQLAAIGRGDDFLEKSIPPDHLVAAVRSRAERARSVRTHMVRDGLTGLLNHAAVDQHLEREIARARRMGSDLALALIDVDHFKRVNDTHGHPAGDRVLKSLARLLQQGLRNSDVIGRYGGEEFALILPDTDGARAVEVLERLRTSFAGVRHRAGDTVFSVTLSAGVACLADYPDTAMLTAAADQALYAAKRSGRNRIVRAAPDELAAPAAEAAGLAPGTHEWITIAGAPPRVLVVDDDPDIGRLLAVWLASRGMEVDVLESGEAAVSHLDRGPPDLIFLDLLMPGMNGLQVLEHIRDAGLDSAVILTTAFGSEQVAIDALRRGADDYLRKPFHQREFQAVLERSLARLELRRSNTRLRRAIEALQG
ncbi:MAG TPA: response regulator [Roseiflexaceae bacterium]|nr:response regulator [Roseiflexaceae bacterium]